MDALTVLRLTMSIVTQRLIMLAGLVMACFLAAWVMYEPSWERVVALAIFNAMSYLLLTSKEKSNDVRNPESKDD